MNKIVMLAVSMFFMSNGLFSQPAGTSDVATDILSEIVQNNKQLKAYQGYIDSRDLSNQTMNNINDLELSGAVLPLGNHSSGLYMEFQVSQSFEFPSTYRSRAAFMEQDRKRQEIAFLKNRQEILSEVSELMIRLIYHQKRKEIEINRTDQARHVYEQIEELYEQEEVSKLDLNKAKVAWLQQQFSIGQIESKIDRITTQLKNLNGGIEIASAQLSLTDYSGSLVLAGLDSLWQEKTSIDPFIRYHEESERTALSNIEVQKKERLPEFDIGLNYEGVKGENYAGFSGGLSIPIWNRKNNVKAANAQYIYEKKKTDAHTTRLFSEYEQWYEEYRFLLAKYSEYQTSLDGLDSEVLLTKAYELGELSYLEYYMELKFYQGAYDEMLDMERKLFILRNKILKHNL